MANVYSNVEVSTMKRSQLHRPVPHHTSLPFGKWVPIGKPQWVLPHDTWRLDEKGIIRMLTPLLPIMTDISFDVVSFFVPYTIMWSKAKQFFGENDQVAWSLPNPEIDYPKVEIRFAILATTDPDALETNRTAIENYIEIALEDNLQIYYDGSKYTVLHNPFNGTNLDYFGLPIQFNQAILARLYALADTVMPGDIGVKWKATQKVFKINALPFRADQLIYNNWFRNQNVTDPVKIFSYADSDQISGADDIQNWYGLRKAVRWKDLFTSVLPAPQRGPSVSLPINGEANVVYDSSRSGTPTFKKVGTNTRVSGDYLYNDLLTVGGSVGIQASDTAGAPQGNTNKLAYDPDNTLKVDLSSVTMTTINQLRFAVATQRYYEKLSRGGALYRDYLKVMFGVTPADLTIQIPQLLGSKHFHININQVLSTAETLDSSGDVSNPVGSTGAVSATGFSDHIFTNSMSQHGIILTYIAIRKEHSYCQGLDKEWTKSDIFDVYNPTFAHIGEVPVLTQEVYYDPTDGGSIKNEDVLGYNEAWYEYRSDRPVTTGLLSPLNPNGGQLSAFTLCDVFEDTPLLDSNFVEEDSNGLDRALVASASVTDQFVADLLCDYTVARVMPVHSTPGLLDHF